MKTIAISTLGWDDEEKEAFLYYVGELSADYDVELEAHVTTDHYIEVDITDDFSAVEYVLLKAASNPTKVT